MPNKEYANIGELPPEQSDHITTRIRDYATSSRMAAFQGMPELSREVATEIGLNPELAFGIANHLRSNFSRAHINREQAATMTLDALVGFSQIATVPPERTRSFNYLPLVKDGDPRTHLKSALANATWWVNELGDSFFGGKSDFTKSYFRAPLNDNFAITAKGGSGAGAYSLDIAIESNRYGDFRDRLRPSHELWRTGIDTATLADDVHVGRIIRTGTAVKPGDAQKEAEFKHFRSTFATTPQRMLTFLAAQLMYDHSFTHGLALSTQGALDLSSLRNSKGSHKATYSSLHQQMGFSGKFSEHWQRAGDIQTRFYDAFVGPNKESGMKPHEPAAFHLAIESFNAMVSFPSEVPFPIKLCSNQSSSETLRAITAYTVLQGRHTAWIR